MLHRAERRHCVAHQGLVASTLLLVSCCLLWRSKRAGEAETDGGDDGKFNCAYPRGGNVDLRQIYRNDVSVPPKRVVYRTANHTSDESIHGSLLRGTQIEEWSKSVSI